MKENEEIVFFTNLFNSFVHRALKNELILFVGLVDGSDHHPHHRPSSSVSPGLCCRRRRQREKNDNTRSKLIYLLIYFRFFYVDKYEKSSIFFKLNSFRFPKKKKRVFDPQINEHFFFFFAQLKDK